MILAIDPGEIHCGVAEFRFKQCTWASEMTPDLLYASMRRRARERGYRRTYELVVIEEFRLYPWVMQQQGFSRIETVEVIGILKYLCGRWHVPVVMQGASVKKITEGQLRARGVTLRSVTERKGGHAKDAELHGWHWILRNEEKKKEKETNGS